MCEFFSVISDGKGFVDFFKPEDIVSIMISGNKENYDFNSHTSLCHFKGIKAKDEDKWNKWEYSPESKELKQDSLVTGTDSEKVKKFLVEWFKDKDIIYLRNIYGRNTGHSNTGDSNTGHSNTGHRNTGDSNTGHSNTGDSNTGHSNTGDSNTGHRNTGHSNTGHWNTGHWNTANYCAGFFCTTTDTRRLFNKPCSEEAAKKAREIHISLPLTEWTDESDVTKVEKEANWFHSTLGGYLKVNSYKEAWEIFSKREPKKIMEIKSWENFDAKIFEEITGLK